ncbi:DNA repair protein rad51d [Kickxella alabastrina]|uniref:DNA repair protein rad51d n=1 Tax=Kickxella alabastrina TaxID=61397 RepID=A0ACC1IRC0_9FUNG|nr:DNA repair protein rad51d [Kickxella alabastrina]
MPQLGSAKYIKEWIDTASAPFPTKECLAALEVVGIRTDYDLLLQSDVLELTPAALHSHICALRMTVLAHFASPGRTALSLLEANRQANNAHGQGTGDMVIGSGIRELDTLLGGGVRISQITEICGNEGSGKTRISIEFTAAHLVPKPQQLQQAQQAQQQQQQQLATEEREIPRTKVYYMSSSPLSIWRVEQTLRRRLKAYPAGSQDVMFRSAMERLIVVDCEDIDALLTFLYKYADARDSLAAEEEQQQQQCNESTTDLLIIDSIRPLLLNVIRLEGDASIATHSVKTVLRRITSVRAPARAAVIITNGVAQRNDWQTPASFRLSHEQLAATRLQPSLGAAWVLVSHVHLYLKRYDQPSGDNSTSVTNGLMHGQCRTVAVVLKSHDSATAGIAEFDF